MNVHQKDEQMSHYCHSSEIFRAHEMEARGEIPCSQAWNQRGHNDSNPKPRGHDDTDPRALGCSHGLGAGCVPSNWMWSTEGIGMHLPGEDKGITQRRWWVTEEVSISVKEASWQFLLFLRIYSSRKKKHSWYPFLAVMTACTASFSCSNCCYEMMGKKDNRYLLFKVFCFAEPQDFVMVKVHTGEVETVHQHKPMHSPGKLASSLSSALVRQEKARNPKIPHVVPAGKFVEGI